MFGWELFGAYRVVSRGCNKTVEEVGLWSNGYTELFLVVSLALLDEKRSSGVAKCREKGREGLLSYVKALTSGTDRVLALAVQPRRQYNGRSY